MGRDAGLATKHETSLLERSFGHQFHLESSQLNVLVGIGSFALGVLAAKEMRAVRLLESLETLPRLTLVDARAAKMVKTASRLESLETSYLHGQSTIENWRGQKWLHQEGYARVPMHKEGASWWHDTDQNLTWVKTSQYLESRGNDTSYFRSYNNGGIQIRFSNGYEFYESSLPERRKIVLNVGVTRH